MNRNPLEYTGQPQRNTKGNVEHCKNRKPYLPSEEIVQAVNLAIYLERPLLLRGEPGCGKTCLAKAVACELNLPYEPWFVKSTSKAMDGFYVYDAIERLRDSQISVQSKKEPKLLDDFIRFGPIGKAFKTDKRCVVLIDDIDKADIDFPNDLLEVLEDKSFSIRETGMKYTARHAPIIFITSNDEKELPAAFLRRCLFFYIDFPDRERLENILSAHFGTSFSSVIQLAVERFLELRLRMEDNPVGASKKVSTSELIDWFRALIGNNEKDPEILLEDGKPFPHSTTLIKRHEDKDFLNSAMGTTEENRE